MPAGGIAAFEECVRWDCYRALGNVFRGEKVNGEIHEGDGIASCGGGGAGGAIRWRRGGAFGSTLRRGEESYEMRVIGCLDSQRADVVFGWRQLMKRKVTTGAAVLSLALAIGACTTAFRLIDAMLLRPLPVSDPSRLYAVHFDGVSMEGKPVAWTPLRIRCFRRCVRR